MSTLVKNIKVSARYDLLAPSVQIFYETASTINGQRSLSLVTDFYPDPLPAAPLSQFRALQFTVDLQGIQANTSTATITCEPIDPNSPAWWAEKHPQYAVSATRDGTYLASDANNPVVSFSINANSVSRAPNPQYDPYGNKVNDLGYTLELTTGQLTPWMPYPTGQRIEFKCQATVAYANGTVNDNVNLTYQCLTVTQPGGTYTNQQITQYPEPIPQGLAQQIYEAISVLQFEGSLTLQEEDCSGSLSVGDTFNLVNGSGNLAEWASMNAMVQSITENLDTGETEIEFGPPKYLSAGELVDLLRVNRLRVIQYDYGLRATGQPGGNSQVPLGTNTPEKNAVSGTSPANPAVQSQSPDGTGAVITHFGEGTDCFSSWANVPPAGASGTPPNNSITIRLSDADGQSLYI